MTTENNRLIAEFMGFTTVINDRMKVPDGEDLKYKAFHLSLYKLNYHSDWSWLMPVFQKIQTMEHGRFYFDIDPWTFNLTDYKESPEKEVFTLQFDSDWTLIDRYYESVVEFIKWYNTQNNTTTHA